MAARPGLFSLDQEKKGNCPGCLVREYRDAVVFALVPVKDLPGVLVVSGEHISLAGGHAFQIFNRLL